MSTNIKEWNVEDETFWESTAKRVAYRNLWISVPALLCGFAIWLMWGIITVQMLISTAKSVTCDRSLPRMIELRLTRTTRYRIDLGPTSPAS